jgi:hypothetical protein
MPSAEKTFFAVRAPGGGGKDRSGQVVGQFVDVSHMLARDDERVGVAQGERIQQDGDFSVLEHNPTLTLTGEDRARPTWFPKVSTGHELRYQDGRGWERVRGKNGGSRMEDRGWRIEDGGSRMEDRGWRVEDGGSRMEVEDGGSRMEGRGWRVEDGGSRMAYGF